MSVLEVSEFNDKSSDEEFFDALSSSEDKNLDDNESDKILEDSQNKKDFNQPTAPPRKKKLVKNNSFQSKTNSEFNITVVPKEISKIEKSNLTSFVDDIVSIQGDLSVTDAYVINSDRNSVHVDDMKKKDLSDDIIAKVVEENLIKTNQNIKETTDLKEDSKTYFEEDKNNLAEDKKIISSLKNLTVEEPKDSSLKNSQLINPINLHLLKLTNYYNSGEEEEEELDCDAETIEDEDLVLNTLSKNTGSFETINEELKTSSIKKEPLKNTVKNLKKIGQGLMKGVRNVKNSTNIPRETVTDKRQCNLSSEADHHQFKFKSNRKKENADFEGMRVIQELNDCKGAIWCMKWSICGKLLAVAGQDQLLRVYCCYSAWKYFTQLRSNASGGPSQISPNSTKERSYSGSRNSISSINDNLSFESVLHNNSFSKIINEDTILSEEGPLLLFSAYNGHKADVLDIAWSKNHFLLSSSMDKTVLLWHVSRVECLCIFRHIDFVTTIQFHPRDDRYFLSGSLDGKVRLWNIPDKRVTLWNEVNALPVPNNRNKNSSISVPSHGLITASAFVQNGKFAVIGTYDGRVIFYTTDQLKYFTQLHVGSEKQLPSLKFDVSNTDRSGRPRQHYKITGIEGLDENKILVTTNDSRIRLYDLRDLSLACKYKGHTNISSQIKASISHDNKFIVCGSENSSFYIWKLHQDNTSIGQRRDRNSYWESVRLLPNNNLLHAFQHANNSAGININKNNPGIITAATFATFPPILDQNAKYVIAVADFNGTIRLFSK